MSQLMLLTEVLVLCHKIDLAIVYLHEALRRCAGQLYFYLFYWSIRTLKPVAYFIAPNLNFHGNLSFELIDSAKIRPKSLGILSIKFG